MRYSLADNRQAVKAYKQTLEDLKKLEVVIGLPKGKSDGTVIQYGAVHEFGAPERNISRRSFIRVPTLNAENQIMKFAENQAKQLEKGVNATLYMSKIGAFVQGIVLKSFRENDWEANSEATIKRKGSSAPLIDKGQLIQSITWDVRNASKS